KMEGKFISSASIRFVDDRTAFITGFYNDLTDKGKNVGVEGAFIAIADPDNLDGLQLHTKDIDPEVKAAITRTGALASLFGADELNAYSIEDINVNADGSGYIVAEQRAIVQTEEQSAVLRTYYFNNLIIYRFDSNLDISWISTIPKQQSTTVS